MTDPQDFGTTMEGLARGLRVAEIATFDPDVAHPDDTVTELRGRFATDGYDHLPVREEDRIIGVISLQVSSTDTLVRDAMEPLSDWMLISGADPISDLVPLFRQSQYRLVVHRGKINGIVTRSDLLKLPVRVLAFSQIAHLEMLMGAIIVGRSINTEWVDRLGPKRRDKVFGKQSFLSTKGMDPPLIECCDFCDKRDLLRRIVGLSGTFNSELKEIEELRNQVAHSANYASDSTASDRFVERLMLVTKWIGNLHMIYEQSLVPSLP